MSNYFMQHYFASKYWDTDFYFRLGVPVPVPPRPVPQGAGVAVGYRRMLSCEWLDKESRELKFEVNKAWEKLQKKAHRDPLDRKRTTKRDIDRIREEELIRLRGKIRELDEKYRALRREGLESEWWVQKLKKRSAELERCYKRVNRRLDELERELERLTEENKHQREELRRQREESHRRVHDQFMSLLRHEKKVKELETAKAEAESAKAVAEEKLAHAEASEKAADREALAVREDTATTSIKDAVPYAIGSAVVFLGTYLLVPDDLPAIKFVGYTGGTVLAGVAIWKAAPAIAGALSGAFMGTPPSDMSLDAE